MPIDTTTWWLDWSALPERYLWARLSVATAGKAEVLDCDGVTHQFTDELAARAWLLEDEYSSLEALLQAGEVSPNVVVPQGSTRETLIARMRGST